MTYQGRFEITGSDCGDEERLMAEEMGFGWGSVKKVAGKGVKVATKVAIAPVTFPAKATAKVTAKVAPKVLPKSLAKAAVRSTAFASKATQKVATAPINVASKLTGAALAVANQIKKYGLKVALAPVLLLFWQAVDKRQKAGEKNRTVAAQWVANQVKAKLGPLGTVFVFLLKEAGTSVSGGSYVGAFGVDDWAATITAASAALAAIMKYVDFGKGLKKQFVDPAIALMAQRKAAEEAQRKRAEEEARQRAAEEARRRAEEEARRRAEEEARQRAAEEARQRAAEEAARQAAEAAAEAPSAEEAVDQEIQSEEPTAEEAVEAATEEEPSAEDAVEGMF